MAYLTRHTSALRTPGVLPWITRVVGWLCFAHLGVSVVASIAVVVLTRGDSRWFAWAAILAHGVFTMFMGRCADPYIICN